MKDKKGIALILAVGILALLAGIATSFALNMRLEYKAAINYYNGVKAHYLAEAAAERAIYELKTHVLTSAFDDLTEQWAASTAYTNTISGNTAESAIRDEQRWVSVNTGNQTLLENLFQELGMSAAEASTVRNKIISNRPANGYIHIQELMSIGTLDEETEYNTIKGEITVSAYVDPSTARSAVNINTCSDEVLRAILTDLSDGATTVSSATVTSVFDAIKAYIAANNSITTWATFDQVVDGAAPANEATIIKDNCNPNRTMPLTSTTEFCFNSGGYYEITGTGDVLVSGLPAATREIRAIVRIYDIYTQSTKDDFRSEDFNGNGVLDTALDEASASGSSNLPGSATGLDYNEDGDATDTVSEDLNGNGVLDIAIGDKVTWLDSCPVESTDLFGGYSIPSDARTIPGSIKLGYWDDFELVTEAYTRLQLEGYVGDWSFEDFPPGWSPDTDLELCRKWTAPDNDWGKYALYGADWTFGDFSLRVWEQDAGDNVPFKREAWLWFRGIEDGDPTLFFTNGCTPSALPDGEWLEFDFVYAYWVNVIDPDDPEGKIRLPGQYIMVHDAAGDGIPDSGDEVRKIYYTSEGRADNPIPPNNWYPAPLIEKADYNEHLRLWPNSNYLTGADWNNDSDNDMQPVEYMTDHALGSGAPNNDSKTFNLFVQSYTADAYVYTSDIDPGGYLTNSMLPINIGSLTGRIGFMAFQCYPAWDDLRIIPNAGAYTSKNLRPVDIDPTVTGYNVKWGTIVTTVTIPASADAASETVLLWTMSVDAGGTSDIWRAPSGDLLQSLDGTSIQYRAVLDSSDADLSETPVLEDVIITYVPSSKITAYTISP